MECLVSNVFVLAECSLVGCWLVGGMENGVLTIVVVVVWDDDGGEWYLSLIHI